MEKSSVYPGTNLFCSLGSGWRNPSAALIVLRAMLRVGCGEKNLTRSYYPSGSVKTEAVTKDAVLNGRAVMLAESAQKLSEAESRGGVLNGKSAAHFPDGKIKATAEYQDGALHGASTAYHANGQKASEAQFYAGALKGVAKHWGEDGVEVAAPQ